MITRNRTRIVAALASATMKDFHSAEERELLAKLYETMEKNNEADKASASIPVAPVKRRTRKPKMFEAPRPEPELVAADFDEADSL